jgi:NADPH-dependent 2,4-dienoyl-CoA reductase/sulfur reductase-like enzyme
MKRHVILGAGPAGVIAAETIRKHAPDDHITLVGDEPEPPYSRMAIPYLLIGKVGESGTYLRHSARHFESLRIEGRRTRARGIDVKSRQVQLADGSTLPFDTLLIATGSQPVRPPIPGMNLPGVHSCWTLADARAIAERAAEGSRVLLMGAGFIGCIVMDPLATRGVKLSIVEMGDRMVPRMMGPAAGGMIKRWCESKGVKVYTSTRVESIEPGGSLLQRVAAKVGLGDGAKALKVRLANGEQLEVDLVVSATGVRPNIGFLEHSGVKCLVGVLTDEHMQTSVPGIYAAGDCAEAFDKISGKTIVSAIQPNAAEQARVAGLNMAGQAAELKGVTQINVLDTLGLVSTSFGNWAGVPGGRHAELTDEKAWKHLSLQFDGDRLIGCNSIGWTEHVGVMRGLVEGGVCLGEWADKLAADPTLLMEAYLARAQGQEQRGHLALA